MARPTAGSYSSICNNMANNTHSLSLASASSQYAYREDVDCVNIGETGGTLPTLFMAWVKPVDDQHYCIASKARGFDEGAAVGDGGFEFSIISRTTDIAVPYLKLYQFQGTPPNFIGRVLIPTTGGVAPGQWAHFAAFAYITGTGPFTLHGRFYIDGAFLEDVTVGSSDQDVYDSNGADRFYVGVALGSDLNLYGLFNGQIDELHLRTAADTTAADAYVSANYRKCLTQTGNGFWHFNNDLTDDSGNANTLTGVNTPTYSTSAFTCFVPKSAMIL